MAAGIAPSEADPLPVCIPPRQSTDSPVDDGARLLPHASGKIERTAFGTTSDAAVVAAACQCPSPVMPSASAALTPSAPEVPSASGLAEPVRSLRGIATGAMAIWAVGWLLPSLRLLELWFPAMQQATPPCTGHRPDGCGRSRPAELHVYLQGWCRAARSRRWRSVWGDRQSFCPNACSGQSATMNYRTSSCMSWRTSGEATSGSLLR